MKCVPQTASHGGSEHKTPTRDLGKKAGLVPDKACGGGAGCLPYKRSLIPPNTCPFDFLDEEEENWLSPASCIFKQIRNSLPWFVA